MKKIKAILILCICVVAIIVMTKVAKLVVEDINQWNRAESKGMSITEYRAFQKEEEIVLETGFDKMLNSQQ